MKYIIHYKNTVFKEMRSIPRKVARTILDEIDQLAFNPRPQNSKKMQDISDHYRLRIGRYRIVYHFKKHIEIITIIKVKHRKDVYRF